MNQDEMRRKTLHEILEDKQVELFSKISGSSDGEASLKVRDKIWAFSGVSGGAGTSTIVTNLAYKLTKKGLNVLLIDLNLLNPFHCFYHKASYSVKDNDLYNLVLGEGFNNCVKNKGTLSILGNSIMRSTLEVVSMENINVSENLENVLKGISPLYDVILIDCPYNCTDRLLVNVCLYLSDFIYLVLDESGTCVSNLEKTLKVYTDFGIRRNKVNYIFNKRTSLHLNSNFLEFFDIELDTILPFDLSIIESGLKGNIYLKKGASLSDNAKEFFERFDSLTNTILNRAGYVTSKKKLIKQLESEIEDVQESKFKKLFKRKSKVTQEIEPEPEPVQEQIQRRKVVRKKRIQEE